METIRITVTHFYNHPNLYAFMPQHLFDLLEEAFVTDKENVIVPKTEYEFMIKEFLNSLKN